MLATKKKIKGQVKTSIYYWLVKTAATERRAISEVIADIVTWFCAIDSGVESGLAVTVRDEDVKAAASPSSVNFQADASLLRAWERMKKRNGLTNDAKTIRIVLTYAYRTAQTKNVSGAREIRDRQARLF